MTPLMSDLSRSSLRGLTQQKREAWALDFLSRPPACLWFNLWTVEFQVSWPWEGRTLEDRCPFQFPWSYFIWVPMGPIQSQSHCWESEKRRRKPFAGGRVCLRHCWWTQSWAKTWGDTGFSSRGGRCLPTFCALTCLMQLLKFQSPPSAFLSFCFFFFLICFFFFFFLPKHFL